MKQTLGNKKTETVKMTSAQGIVHCMKLEGVTKVFCVPGESYLPVMDAIYDEETIELISARHEGGASFMAEGYAKATKIPGVVMATRGVGGGNLTIGVHTAYQDSTPMVVFLGQVHSKFRGREGFQEVDLENFFGPIAKWTVEIKDSDRVPELVQRAFRIAKTGRPGPVVVSLPEDMLREEAMMNFAPPVKVPKPVPAAEELADISGVLAAAERPVILAGGGINSSGGVKALVRFAEKFNIPVMAAFRRHDVFPNNHPLYVGHLGLGTAGAILETARNADAILAVGTRLSEVTTQDYSIPHLQQKLVHIDIDDKVLGKVFPTEVGVVADAKSALDSLLTIELSATWKEWSRKSRINYEETCELAPVSGNDLSMKAVVAQLQEILPPDAIITNDAGNFAGWLHSFYQFNQEKTYIGPTSGAMGYGLPAAIGAKAASPEKVVVSLSGDGGMMMTVQELETAVRHRLPVISIVINNQMYGTIRMHQEMSYPERVIGTQLGSVSFAAMADAMGAIGINVSTVTEFQQAVADAMNNQVPTVIEINTDPEQISVTKTITDLR